MWHANSSSGWIELKHAMVAFSAAIVSALLSLQSTGTPAVTGEDLASELDEAVLVRVHNGLSRAHAKNLKIIRAKARDEATLPNGWWRNVTAPIFNDAYVQFEMSADRNSDQASLALVSSPFSIFPWDVTNEYWVRAPDTAWSRFLIEGMVISGEDEWLGPPLRDPVVLHPYCSDMDIYIDGPETEQYCLRLSYENQFFMGSGGGAYGGRSTVVILDGLRSHSFAGLVPTRYRVHLTHRERPFQSFDSAVVVLTPGEHQVVQLVDRESEKELQDPEIESERIHGVFQFEDGWQDFMREWATVQIYPLDRNELDWTAMFQTGKDWSAVLTHGEHKAHLFGFGEVARFHVSPDDSQPIVIDLGEAPAFANVQVQLHGGPLPSSFSWRSEHDPEGQRSYPTYVSDSGQASFYVLPGKIEIQIRADGNSRMHELVWEREVVAGDNKLDLELPVSAGLDVILTVGAKPIPEEVWQNVMGWNEPAEVLLGSRAASLRRGVVSFSDVEPGHHTLHIPPIHGYWSAEMRSVEIEAGRRTRLEIELEPLVASGK